MKPILVTGYTNPDLDGFAGVIAYTEFLNTKKNKAVSKISGQPHTEVKYIMARFDLSYPAKIKNIISYDKIVLVDSSSLNGLDKKLNPKNVIEIIDHRKVNDAPLFLNAKRQIELVGSAATLIAEKFRKENITPAKRSAILLYAAIISNTLNFQAKVTTKRDRAAARWLNAKLNLSDSLAKDMFKAKSDLCGGKLEKRITNDFAWFNLNNKKVGIAQIEMVGAKELVKQRKKEILQKLNTLKKDLKLDFIFLSIIDLGAGFNLFITPDKNTQDLISPILNLKFKNNEAVRPELIMRKEIVPWLKKKLK
ncbi:MAG: DHHA2 domain-containing protein [Patescibacteria group bacterium]